MHDLYYELAPIGTAARRQGNGGARRAPDLRRPEGFDPGRGKGLPSGHAAPAAGTAREAATDGWLP